MIARRLGMILAIPILAGVIWSLSAAAPSAGENQGFFAFGKPGTKEPLTFERPRCISVAPDGTLWILDLTGRIQHVKQDGTYLGQAQMPEIKRGRPQGIDVDSEGCLYVVDTHYNRVVKFSPDGQEILMMFGEGAPPDTAAAAGQFNWPCAIVVDDDGTIYTAEYGGADAIEGGDRIQVWTPEGKWLRSFGRFGTQKDAFMRPAGLALDGQGRIYIADACNHRVQVFSTAGTHLFTWGVQGRGPGEFSFLYDIAIDKNDSVYTIEYGAHRVQQFSLDGTFRGTWGTQGIEGATLDRPWGLDVTPEGTVFIADTYHGRVVRAPAFESTP